MADGRKKGRLRFDTAVSVLSVLVIFAGFHAFDGFEGIYNLTRHHESWELDEYILLILALPLPITWFAYRRMQDTARGAVERVELIRSLAHSRKLESLGTLASGAAHELNNQLLPVMTMSELVRDNLAESDPNFRKMELVIKGASNAKRTVAKILKFSRISDEGVGTCEIGEVCRATEDVLQATSPTNVTASFIIDAGFYGHVEISRDSLQGAIVNLFSNAIDALDGQPGKISLTTGVSVLDGKSGEFDLLAGTYAWITVTDSGSGMNESIRERIFDPFYTTKAPGKGVGLGLSIIHTTIKQAGGDVIVESKAGHGSSFTIYLPFGENDLKSPTSKEH